MEDPLVSICCLAYNHEPYIRQCIEGFLMQKTTFPIEILIHDDASTDNTAEIIREYEAKFPIIIKPIYQIENQYSKGVGVSRAFQFPRAKGKYIALCEGDDYWIDPLKLQRQMDFLECNKEYGLVCTDFNILHLPTGKLEKALFKNQPKRYPIYTNFEDFLLAAGFMAPCTWLLRRELLPTGNYNCCDESFVWLLEIFLKSKVFVIPEVTGVYRDLPESASHSSSVIKNYNRKLGILKIQLDYIKNYNLTEFFARKVLQKYYSKVLPELIILRKKKELIKANYYLSDTKRSFRVECFLKCSKILGGRQLVLFYYWIRRNLMH